MDVSKFTQNLFTKDLEKRVSCGNSKVILQAQENTLVARGLVRGSWVFGVEIVEDGHVQQMKLVSSTDAEILRFVTLTGVVAKITRLGFTVIKIPSEADQYVIYSGGSDNNSCRTANAVKYPTN